MKTAEQVAAALRALRGDKSQAAVANAIGISPSALAMYENGERMPRDGVKVALARYYGVSVGSLFFGEESHVS
jgi:Predicted transcriptional regulators